MKRYLKSATKINSAYKKDDSWFEDADIKVIKRLSENQAIIEDGYGYAITNGWNNNRFFITEDGRAIYDYAPSKSTKDIVDKLIQSGKLVSQITSSEDIMADSWDDWYNDFCATVDDRIDSMVSGTVWNVDDYGDYIFLDVTTKDDHVISFSIPMDDLYQDLDGDVDYVVDAVVSALNGDTDTGDVIVDVKSSFVYPEDMEALEDGEYESHVTEPINASYMVRPVTFGDYGVYKTSGDNRAELVYEGTMDECYEYIDSNPDESNDVMATTDEEPEFVNMGLGNQYWYFTKHGCSPGAVPSGLDILKIVSTPEGVYPEGDYFLTDDQVITTEALRKYEIKEKAPDFDYE